MSNYLNQILRVLKNLKPLKRGIMFSSLILSHIIPKKKNLILFSTGSGKFIDNSKYMFLELENEENDLQTVWMSENKQVVESLQKEDYTSLYVNSLKAKYLILRSETVVYTHYSPRTLNSWLYLGSNRVNLWHGLPYKDTSSKKNSQGKIIDFLGSIQHKVFYNPDYFVEPSRIAQVAPKKNFEAKSICAGYPRNDIFANQIPGSDLFAQLPEDKDYIVFMPTWRDKENNWDEEKSLENEIKWKELDKLFSKLDKTLILKPHHYSRIEGDFDNIKVIENSLDVYPLLKDAEALITDYSSVMFDFIHTDKPVIRYQFDREEYEENKGINDELKNLAPGTEVRNMEQLKEALQDLEDIDTDYEEIMQKAFECRKEGLQAQHILDQID